MYRCSVYKKYNLYVCYVYITMWIGVGRAEKRIQVMELVCERKTKRVEEDIGL